jgi:hypothetical protein
MSLRRCSCRYSRAQPVSEGRTTSAPFGLSFDQTSGLAWLASISIVVCTEAFREWSNQHGAVRVNALSLSLEPGKLDLNKAVH